MGCGNSASTRRASVIPIEEVNNHISSLVKTKYNIIQVTNETLQDYINLENALQEKEDKHILENLQIKTEQMQQLDEVLLQLNQLLKEYNDKIIYIQHKINEKYTSLKELILNKSHSDNHLLTEEEEILLDLLNAEEKLETEAENTNLNITRNKIDKINETKDKLKLEINHLNKEANKIKELYTKKDELLNCIFNGNYGSDLESQLELQLDSLFEQKYYVDQAYLRWKQAHEETKQASSQLAFAIQTWKLIADILPENNENKYKLTFEVRNNLIEASHNLRNAQILLSNIAFCYCTPEELETLDKAITFIFTDIQTAERYEYAMACYQIAFKRVTALEQWIDHVLTATISRDSFAISKDFEARKAELKNERIKLIKYKIENRHNKLDVQNQLRVSDSGVDSEFDDTSTADEQIARLFDASKSERKGTYSLTPAPTKNPLSYSTSLSSVELVSLPQREEILSKIEYLRNKYKCDMTEFQKTLKINQVKVAQGLKNKLQDRKNRRIMHMNNNSIEGLQEAF